MKNMKKIIVATPLMIAILTIAFIGALGANTCVAFAEEELHYGAISSFTTSSETITFSTYSDDSYYDSGNFPCYYNTNSALTNACAPVAGAIVMGFFDRYYTNLIPSFSPGYMSGGTYQYYPQFGPFATYIQNTISTLYTDMGTNQSGNGTTRTEYQSGMSTYVQNAGYSISFSNSMSGSIPNMSNITTQLEAGKVVTLYLNGYTYTHMSFSTGSVTYSHTTYTGTHVAIAYGYLTLYYYNSSNVNFRTDKFLVVSTGQQSPQYSYILIDSTKTGFVAADVTNIS